MNDTEELKRFTLTVIDSTAAAKRYTTSVLQGATDIHDATASLMSIIPTNTAAGDPNAVLPAGVAPTPAGSVSNSTSRVSTVNTVQQNGQSQFSSAIVPALLSNTQATADNTAAIMLQLQKSGTRSSIAPPPTSPGAGGGADDPAAKGKSSLDQFGNALESLGTKGRSTILSLVSAADPSAFSTFQASITSVAIEVGAVFVPYIDMLSGALQTAASWFASIDSPTKVWIGRLGTAVVAIGGLITALKAVGLASAAGGGLKALLGLAPLALTPVGLAVVGVTALSAGIITATGNWERLGTAAGRAIGIMKTAPDAGPIGPDGQQRPETAQDISSRIPWNMRDRITQAPMDKQPEEVKKAIALTEEQITKQKAAILNSVAVEEQLAAKRTAVLEEQAPALQRIVDVQTKKYFDRVNAPERDRRLGVIPKESIEYGTILTEIDQARKWAKDVVAPNRGLDITPLGTEALRVSDPIQDIKEGKPTRIIVSPLAARPAEAANAGKPLPGIDSVSVLEKRVSDLKSLLSLVSGSATAKPEDKTENIRLPINARFTDAMAFSESVQTQALNVGDMDARNQLRTLELQLQRLGEGNGLLSNINANVKALESAISALRFWEGR